MLKVLVLVAAVSLQMAPPRDYAGTYWAAVYMVTAEDGSKREVQSTLLHREDCESLGGHKRVLVERATITNRFSFCQLCFHPTRPHNRAPSISAETAYDPDAPQKVLPPQRPTKTVNVAQDTGRSWTGQGSKQTPTFHMTAREWTVKWSHSGDGLFAVKVYDDNDEHVALIGNIIGPGSDSSSVRATPGRFYLKITGDTWTVSVP